MPHSTYTNKPSTFTANYVLLRVAWNNNCDHILIGLFSCSPFSSEAFAHGTASANQLAWHGWICFIPVSFCFSGFFFPPSFEWAALSFQLCGFVQGQTCALPCMCELLCVPVGGRESRETNVADCWISVRPCACVFVCLYGMQSHKSLSFFSSFFSCSPLQLRVLLSIGEEKPVRLFSSLWQCVRALSEPSRIPQCQAFQLYSEHKSPSDFIFFSSCPAELTLQLGRSFHPEALWLNIDALQVQHPSQQICATVDVPEAADARRQACKKPYADFNQILWGG